MVTRTSLHSKQFIVDSHMTSRLLTDRQTYVCHCGWRLTGVTISVVMLMKSAGGGEGCVEGKYRFVPPSCVVHVHCCVCIVTVFVENLYNCSCPTVCAEWIPLILLVDYSPHLPSSSRFPLLQWLWLGVCVCVCVRVCVCCGLVCVCLCMIFLMML